MADTEDIQEKNITKNHSFVVREENIKPFQKIDTSNLKSYIATRLSGLKRISTVVCVKREILHEEFENIIVVTKYRPQSARRDVSDAANKIFC